jgi:RNA polymerase sigma-70 factor (ECF subfamily)
MTDAELIERARSDPAAFRTLYDRYAGRIHRYHLRRTRHEDAALDLTAETFAQAWVARLRFADAAGGSAGPWLYGIARHVLLVSVRRGRLERRACERLGVMEALDRTPAAVEPQERWLDGLDEALADLPAAQREALVLRVVADLGYDEIADHLSTSEQAARARVSRGLTTLRSQLTDPTEARP